MPYSTKENNKKEENYFEDGEPGTLWCFDRDNEMKVTHAEMFAFYESTSDYIWDIKETSIILKLGQMATTPLFGRPRYAILALDAFGEPTVGWVNDPDILIPCKEAL